MALSTRDDYLLTVCGGISYDLMDLLDKRACTVKNFTVLIIKDLLLLRCNSVSPDDDLTACRNIGSIVDYLESSKNDIESIVILDNEKPRDSKYER